VVCCDCNRTTTFGPASSWVGPVFTRVPPKTLEDLAARRVFAADDAGAYVCERLEVRDAAVELWRSQHAVGVDALAEVAAVALARPSGASWADIGRRAGMARQSAQERWRRIIGHDGYHLRADLRLSTPVEGGRSRSVQSGYHAQWGGTRTARRSASSGLGAGPCRRAKHQAGNNRFNQDLSHASALLAGRRCRGSSASRSSSTASGCRTRRPCGWMPCRCGRTRRGWPLGRRSGTG